MSEGQALSQQMRERVRQQYRPALIVMTGEAVGERMSLHGNALIGRDPQAQLLLSDPGVSWQHAFVEDRGDRYVVVDLDSTNGTFLNGNTVTEAELSSGDKINVGGTTIRFEVQDATDEAYTQIIAHLVNIDDLTGLYLRRRFEAELGGLVATARVEHGSIGLLAMDLDGVKAINDAHGHLFGAYTIAECGKVIGRILEGIGFACRFGGDEFVAALPHHDRPGATVVAERIRQSVADHSFVHEGITLKPGISIGVAAFPGDASDALPLFRAADEALYEAKRAGKNRVATYQRSG
jgi:two-component system, cell cycle response regulator